MLFNKKHPIDVKEMTKKKACIARPTNYLINLSPSKYLTATTYLAVQR
jgi:hypothetical protein